MRTEIRTKRERSGDPSLIPATRLEGRHTTFTVTHPLIRQGLVLGSTQTRIDWSESLIKLQSTYNRYIAKEMLPIADQAEERGQSEELNNFMDKWEKEQKEALVQTADQAEEQDQFNLQLQPTQESKVRNLDLMH